MFIRFFINSSHYKLVTTPYQNEYAYSHSKVTFIWVFSHSYSHSNWMKSSKNIKNRKIEVWQKIFILNFTKIIVVVFEKKNQMKKKIVESSSTYVKHYPNSFDNLPKKKEYIWFEKMSIHFFLKCFEECIEMRQIVKRGKTTVIELQY